MTVKGNGDKVEHGELEAVDAAAISLAEDKASFVQPILPTIEPALTKNELPKSTLHPAIYVVSWIALSSIVILFNKDLLEKEHDKFPFPVILTTWHLIFAAFMTQVLARTTTLIDGRKKVKMTGRVYMRAIVPIGFFFSLSLICSNMAYLYLSVAFIQMLKASTPVAVLLATWALGMAPPSLKLLANVSFIVIGVIIASFGEIHFVLVGFIFQILGIAFEATRLAMVQRLLDSPDLKMDPLVSLYYFAPVCAAMNIVVALFLEVPRLTMAYVFKAGVFTLLANGMVAFMLNVSVVLLIGKTSSLVLTLCGVLKDILLVTISTLWWNTPISLLQIFGYTIAVCGLLYFKLGLDKIKESSYLGFKRLRGFSSAFPGTARWTMFVVFMIIIGTFLVHLGYPLTIDSPESYVPY